MLEAKVVVLDGVGRLQGAVASARVEEGVGIEEGEHVVGEVGRSLDWPSRLTALLYGVGAALTLDEFALWLRLEDVHWAREGRESIDAIVLLGALLGVGAWGGRFLHALAREAAGALRR